VLYERILYSGFARLRCYCTPLVLCWFLSFFSAYNLRDRSVDRHQFLTSCSLFDGDPNLENWVRNLGPLPCVKLHKISYKTSNNRLRLEPRPRPGFEERSLASWLQGAASPHEGMEWRGERRTRGRQRGTRERE